MRPLTFRTDHINALFCSALYIIYILYYCGIVDRPIQHIFLHVASLYMSDEALDLHHLALSWAVILQLAETAWH